MANEGEINVKLKISADNAGAKSAEQSVKNVGSAAKKTAESTKSGLEQMQAATGRVSGAFEAMKKVLTGFGIGGLVMAVVGGISKISSSFNHAQKQAEEFQKIQDNLNREKAIATLANDYNRLTEAINASAAAQNHQIELIDQEVSNRRRLINAKLEAAKEDEIAKLDENASDYAEKLDVIEKKYAKLKAAQADAWAIEDLTLEKEKKERQAEQTEAQAGAQDAATKLLKARLRDLRGKKWNAEMESIQLNDEDKTGAGSIVGKTLGQLFTGDWGRMSEAKTAEGDAIRRDAAQRAAQYDLEIQKLEAEIQASEAKSAELRKEAGRIREKATVSGEQIEAVKLEGETARKSAARQASSAGAALRKKHDDEAAKKAKEEADAKAHAEKISDAESARAALSQRREELLAKIRAEQAKKDAAGLSVYEAQGAMDAARLGGNTRAQQNAHTALKNAKDAAQNVNAAADSTIAALTETLRSVEARLKAAQNFLERNNKQQQNAWSESPAGE